MRIIRNGRRGRPRIIYSKYEEKFYKKHKKKIIEGLGSYVAKNKVKSTFFASAKEEKAVNPGLTKKEAIEKTFRSREFMTADEVYEGYKSTVLSSALKGQKQKIKAYLGIPQNQSLKTNNLVQTSEGWEYKQNGRTVLLRRNGDTKTEGYEVIYA